MRMIMKVEFPVETGNAKIKDGTLPTTMQSILDDQNAEAAYFFAVNGKRGGIIIVDIEEASQIPALAEPWFLALNASVEIQPAMTIEDLTKAGPGIGQTVEKYG